MRLFFVQRSDKFCGGLAIVLAEVAIGGSFRTETGVEEEVALVLQRIASQFVRNVTDTQAVDIIEEGGIGILTETTRDVVLI